MTTQSTLNTPAPFASPWLEPARNAIGTYRANADRFFDSIPTLESLATDDESRQVARLLHQAARARAGVVREWLFSPLWFTGVASPSDLGAEVQNVIEIDRKLGEAWAELVRAQGERMAGNARQAIEATSKAVDRAEELNQKTADAVTSAARSTARANEEAAEASTKAAEDAVTAVNRSISLQAEAADDIAGAVTRARESAEATLRDESASLKAAVVAGNGALAIVKGNTTRDGEKIFHVPGQSSYEQLQTETIFPSQTAAIEAGYRIARSAGGPAIKGNIGRDGSRVYHLPGQVSYDRVEAEALFATEEEAVAEGFRAAQR